MLEDNGAPRLGTQGKELEGEAVTICCAHGDVSFYPIAEVNLEHKGVQM